MTNESSNKVNIKLSLTMMKKVLYLSQREGIEMEDMLIELVSESVTTRMIESQDKNAPNNLITRNGCVYNNNGNNNVQQIQMNYRSIGTQYNNKYKFKQEDPSINKNEDA